MDQRLDRDFVDLLEGGSENVRKILCLKLVDETLVCVFEIHLAHHAVIVDLETAFTQSPSQEVLHMALVHFSSLSQFLQDQGLLSVPLGGHVQDEVEREDVEVKGLLLAELLQFGFGPRTRLPFLPQVGSSQSAQQVLG